MEGEVTLPVGNDIALAAAIISKLAANVTLAKLTFAVPPTAVVLPRTRLLILPLDGISAPAVTAGLDKAVTAVFIE